MISACIIGVSGFGDTHYRDLVNETDAGRMKPVAATIINQDEEKTKVKWLKAHGCEIFEDYKAMLAAWQNKADLCFIPTGIHLHAPMTIAALQAGMNVFVEKPASGAVQYVRAMQQAEKETGRFVAVGYQTMYAAETTLMKETILSGRLGRVECIKARGLWPRMDDYYARNSWAGALKAGDTWVLDSPFNNALAHQFNMIGFLAGGTHTTSAQITSMQAELYRGHDITSSDTACISAETANGIRLMFIVTHCSDTIFGPEIIVRGEKGCIHWDFTTTRIELNDGTVEETPTQQNNEVRQEINRRLQAKAKGEDAFVCSLDIAGVQTLMVNGAHESSDIHTVPAQYIRRETFQQEGHPDTVKTIIEGVDEAIERSFTEEKFFSEVGAPWAVAGKRVDMKEYAEFTGGSLS